MLPPQVLCALARYYGVSVDYLLGETDVRALSGGEKADKGQERAAGNPQAFPNHARWRSRRRRAKKAAAPVGAAVFHPILSWPAAARAARDARSVGSSSASTMPFPAQMASRSGSVPNTNTGE